MLNPGIETRGTRSPHFAEERHRARRHRLRSRGPRSDGRVAVDLLVDDPPDRVELLARHGRRSAGSRTAAGRARRASPPASTCVRRPAGAPRAAGASPYGCAVSRRAQAVDRRRHDVARLERALRHGDPVRASAGRHSREARHRRRRACRLVDNRSAVGDLSAGLHRTARSTTKLLWPFAELRRLLPVRVEQRDDGHAGTVVREPSN